MKKKIIIGIGAGLILTGIIGVNIWRQSMNGDSVGFGGKEQPVTVQTVELQEITSMVSVTGVAKEALKQEIQAKEVLEITKVNKEKGDMVQKGDILFEVDIKPLEDELAKLKLNQEREYLQLSRLSSESSVSGVESAKISSELSRLNYEAAQDEVDTRENDYQKHQELYSAGIISETELEAVKAGLDNAKAQRDNARLNLEQSQMSVREIQSTWANSNQAKDVDIRAQRLALESIDIDISNLQERVEEYRTLGKAEMDGVISAMDLNVGDFLDVQQPVATIIPGEQIIVEAHIREYDIREIQVGQEVIITGDAIDDHMDVKGRVEYIAPVATQAIINGRETTSVLVEIHVVEGVEEVKPGYTVECDITTLKNEEAIVISYEMFGREKDGEKTVFVVNEDNILEERIVEVGITSDFDAEIVSGIEKNERVVVTPSMVLKDGMKVTVNEHAVEEGE